MIIDFRLRPPYGDFLNTAQYNLKRNAAVSRRFGMWQAESVRCLSMPLFLEEMDNSGITQAVLPGRKSSVFGNVSCACIRELMEKWPGRFAGFAGTDPLNYEESFRIIDEEVIHGPFAGLNIEPPFTHSTPMFADDRRLYPVYEEASARRIPVLIMSGGFGDVPLEYCHPSHLETVATDFPDLVIVSPHACWPYGRELIQLALRKPHIYIEPDIYSMGLPGWEDYMLAAGTILQDQFLFGSAHPTLPMEGCLEFYRKQNLSETIWKKIMSENALRVLHHKEKGEA